jgi:LuxR family maltose regulon positive regulatory protein
MDDGKPKELVEPLSERESDVLHLLPSSLSSTEMAGELSISVNTLRSHLKSIYSKLDAHSRYEAIVRAKELGLL